MKKRFCILLGIALIMTACTLDGGNLIGPSGGFVFYDKGEYSKGAFDTKAWRYLECAPENAGTSSWGNTEQLFNKYRYGGYDNWRLPDIDELKNLLNRRGSSMFNVGVYWSSSFSEENTGYAWGIQNGDSPEPSDSSSSSGNVQDPLAYPKDNEFWVRPVRQF